MALRYHHSDHRGLFRATPADTWTALSKACAPLNLLKHLANDLKISVVLVGASELGQRPIVQFILSATKGLTGEVARLLRHAASAAIHDRSEKITLTHLEQAAHAPA